MRGSISLVWLIPSSFLAQTCSSEPVAPSLSCDPGRANEIVFGYQHLADGPSRFDWGQALLAENGSQYLFVDAACQYWAFKSEPLPVGDWGGARVGVLTGASLETFNAELITGPWESIDEELVRDAPYTHPGLHGIWRSPWWAACAGPCDSASSELRELVESAKAWLDRLHEIGTHQVGDDGREARVVVRQLLGPREAYAVMDWNGPTPIDDLAVPESESQAYPRFGGHLRIAGGDAAEMRRLRERHTSGEFGNFAFQFIALDGDADVMFQLTARDTLPFEDEAGLVRPRADLSRP